MYQCLPFSQWYHEAKLRSTGQNRLVGSGMSNKEAYRLVSKVEARSWTQPARNMFNDEAYRLESKEKETRSRTQEGKRSDDGARQLERKEKEIWSQAQKEKKS